MKHYHVEITKIRTSVEGFFKRTFTRLEVTGPPLNAEQISDEPLMVLCTHRSQADYFAVGLMLHLMKINNIRFAAGENLTSLPYLGRRFTQFGAFTVRRGATLGRDYVRGLAEQTAEMMRGGDTPVVFPEGGRSYEGTMMEIRGGLIGAAILLQLREPNRTVRILPMALSYERLPELRYFDMLLKGKHMRRADQGLVSRLVGSVLYYGADALAFSKFLVASRLGINYGALYLDYGEMIPVRSLVDFSTDLVEPARDDFARCRMAMQKASLQVHSLFRGLYRVLPQHVLARVIVDQPDVSTGAAGALCRTLVERLTRDGRNCRSINQLSAQDLATRGLTELSALGAIRAHGSRYAVRNQRTLRYCAATVE